MAATTNRKFTEFYRNSAVFESKQAAITALYDADLINSLKDGEPVLGRYLAYFKWDSTANRYVVEDSPSVALNNYVFTRLVSNETTANSTKEYIVGDIVNVTINGSSTAYKVIEVDSSTHVVPVNTSFTTTTYFTPITQSVPPQYVSTIRVIMGLATIFDVTDNNVSLKKNPPKGKLTFYEEDDVTMELVNKATIISPNKTITIASTVAGKEIDVNIDGETIKRVTTAGNDQGKLYVHHGDTLVESSTYGEEGKLDVRTGNTIKVSAGGSGNPTAGTLDVKTGNTIIVSAGGSGNPEAGTLDVKTGTTLKISSGGSGNPEAGTIDVNIDNETIKQDANSNALYVPLGSGLIFDSDAQNIAVNPGSAINLNDDNVNVNYDRQTINVNGNDELTVMYDSKSMELKSHTESSTTVYDGIGVRVSGTTLGISTTSGSEGVYVNIDGKTVKTIASGADAGKIAVAHGTTLTNDSNGLHVNIDDVTIKQNASDQLAVNHNTTIVTDSTTGLGVNIDNKTIKQYSSSATTDPNKLYVNTDGNTIQSNSTSGALELHIDSNDQVLTSSANGLLTNITLADTTTSESSTLPANVYKRYRLLGKNNAQLGDPIDISKDSSLYQAYIGTMDDTFSNGTTTSLSTDKMYGWKSDDKYLYTVNNTDDNDVTVYAQNETQTFLFENPQDGAEISGEGTTLTFDGVTYSYDDGDYNVDAPCVITSPSSTSESLNLIYLLSDGSYELVKINIESLIHESEFKDGLQVTNHEVSAKLWNGLHIHNITGSNGAIEALLGDGLTFDAGTQQSPITDGQRPIKVNVGNGMQITSGAITPKLGTGLGISSETGHEGEIIVNYSTTGSTTQPVYWDGTTHAPVAIGYTIETSVPANAIFTDTTYTGGHEITVDTSNGNVINHDVKLAGGKEYTITGGTISGHGATGTITVPVLTINEYGHVVTATQTSTSITLPDNKIESYTPPTIGNGSSYDYDISHIDSACSTIITNKANAVGDTYDEAIENLDYKLAAIATELGNDEAAYTQGLMDEPRYYAKETTGSASGTKTAALVDSRNFSTDGSGKPFNGTKVDVYFQYAGSTSTATLNINGSGAYAMVYNDDAFDPSLIEAGTTLALVFDAAYNSNAGCWRVVGGVGSGNGGTNGITAINAGNGITVTHDYVEAKVTTSSGVAQYSQNWLTTTAGVTIDPTSASYSGKTFRIVDSGKFYNKAFKWDSVNTKYVAAEDIEETVSINLAQYMVQEGTTTPNTGVDNMLKFVEESSASGIYKLTMEDTWDCGTF